MAEHPDQGDPITKTMEQKARARAGGTVAPVPSMVTTLNGSTSTKTGEYVPSADRAMRARLLADFGD
jgi:hypothetical protein